MQKSKQWQNTKQMVLNKTKNFHKPKQQQMRSNSSKQKPLPLLDLISITVIVVR